MSNGTVNTSELFAESYKLKPVLVARLDYLLRHRDWSQVIRVVENWIEEMQCDPEIRQIKAKAYQGWAKDLVHRRQYKQGHTMLQKAIHIEPDRVELLQELAQVAFCIEQKHYNHQLWRMFGVLIITGVFGSVLIYQAFNNSAFHPASHIEMHKYRFNWTIR